MKRKLLMGMSGMIMVLLSACGIANEEGTALPESRIIETQDTEGDAADSGTAGGGPATMETGNEGGNAEDGETGTEGNMPQSGAGTEKILSAADETSEAYRKIYSRILTEDTGNTAVYSLAYVDNDDVPELVVCDMGYGTYSIYTIKDGEAFCMMDCVTTVELTYYERNGIVALFARWMGGGEEGGYGWYYYQVTKDKTLTDGDVPVLHYSYEAVYDEEGNPAGEGISKYYHMEQEVEEAVYQKMASGLGIVEGSEKVCADSAMGKKEMMDFLGTAAEGNTGQKETTDFEDASGSLTEDEKLLNERMEYYRKSAYYPEITDYWENVREVRDVSGRMEPLYETDKRYLSREELAPAPPAVIHLAKNEIYARHGYIFKSQDLYNYFMGCIWYTPTTAPEDFSEAVFNDFEKENLKLLSELDTMKEAAENGGM